MSAKERLIEVNCARAALQEKAGQACMPLHAKPWQRWPVKRFAVK